MPAWTPATLAYRTFLAVLGAAAVLAVASHAAPAARPDPSPFVYWDVYDTATIPKTLSAMQLYQGTPGRKAKLIPQFFRFEVNSPLWSDDAKKTRWVLTKPGRTIGFKEKDDYWDYPDSTVFVKEFAIDTIVGDTNSRVLWETRVMISRKEIVDSAKGTTTDIWYGYTYKWDKDQKDAKLLPAGMTSDSIRVWPKGLKQPSRMKKWTFPSRNQCEHCHRTSEVDGLHGRSVLGFFTAQLNRQHPDTGMNQLDYFFAKGLLHGQKPFPWEYSPRWRAIDDNSASVDMRARSYIAANCSGCHGKRGIEVGATFGVDLNYDFHTMEPKMEFRHRTVSWPFGLDTIPPFYYPKNDPNNPKQLDSLAIDPALVVPGYPQKSVILFRQRARNTRPGDYDPERNQMPPLASFEVNEPATALVEKWIKEMPVPTPVALALARKHGLLKAGIVLQRGFLVIDGKLLGGKAEPVMAGLDGRRVALRKVSAGVWALPSGLPKGLYIIRAGASSAMRQML